MAFNKKKIRQFQFLGSASIIGIHLVSGVIVGLVAGYYLDKYFGTRPWLTLLFLIFGIIAGYRNMFRELQLMQKKEAELDAQNSSRED